MPFITQGKTNWKFLVIIAILAVIVGGGALIYSKRTEQSCQSVEINNTKEGIAITTDKEEYKQGETIKIKIQNNFNKNIGLQDNNGQLTPVSSIESFINGKWEHVKTKSPCLCNVNCANYWRGWLEIKPGATITDFWNTKDDCTGEILGIGRYRIVFPYTFNLSSQAGASSVSKEFTIKESQTDETSNWKIYKNEDYGFEIKYPAEWNIKSSNSISTMREPISETIKFFEDKREFAATEIFSKYTSDINKENYKNENLYKYGLCNIDFKFNAEKLDLQTINYQDVLIVKGKVNDSSLACFYFKNQNGNLVVFSYSPNYYNEAIFDNIVFHINIINEKPYIKVISPNGGEQWGREKTYQIKWISNGISYPISIQAIAVSIDDKEPENCQAVFGVDKVDPLLEEYYLTVPANACLYGYKIHVCKFDEINLEASICDESNGYFNVFPPTE